MTSQRPPTTTVDRFAARLIRVAAVMVPADRRIEWIEQWDAELWALAAEATSSYGQRRFAIGAMKDALVEVAHGWTEGWTFAGASADLRLTWRRARREPVATAVAIMVAGTGAAAATSLFALFDATLLRTPPALTAPHELLQVGREGPDKFDDFSFPNYRDMADALAPTVTLAGYGIGSAVVGTGASAEVTDVQFVTANFFDVTGVPLARANGAWSAHDDDRMAAVVSDRYWRQHQADVEAAGHTVWVNGRAIPVAGVAPPGFAGVEIGAPTPAMWLPLSLSERAANVPLRGWSWLKVVGRRGPGVTFAAATTAITAVHHRLAVDHATTIGDAITVIDRLGFRPADRREAVRVFALLMGAAALVLLVATANLTGLQLARAAANQPAAAIRVSLGASRARLVRAALIDQVVLAAAGGITAWLLAQWMTGAIRGMLPYDLAVGYAPGPRTLAFALIAPALLSAAVALVPAWRATRPDLIDIIKTSGRSQAARPRMARTLVMVELVLSSALLIAAGLMMRSLAVAAKVDPGFDARRVTVINIRRQPDARPSFVVRGEMAERLRAVKGVIDVGMATRLPLAQSQSTRSFFAADAAYDPDARPIAVVYNEVDRGFFDTLKIHVPASVVWPDQRTTELDEWPAIATTTAVSRLWPQADSPRTVSSGPTQFRLEAEVADVRTRSLTGTPAPAMFVPIGLTGDMPSYVLVRSEGIARDGGASLRHALAPLSSDIIVRSIGPYAPMLVASLSDTVIAARLGVPLSAVAMLLAAIGLYSAAARRVVERRREFGVRLAMGANPHAIVRAELLASLRMSVPAVAAGVLLVGLVQPALARAIVGVSWRDTLVIPVVAVLVVTIALIAAYVPARRASRINPLQAFRE